MMAHLNPWHRAIARLEVADPKLEPSLQPLEVLRSVDLICHLWQQYTNMALFPLAASSVTVRREMTIFNNQTVSRTEGAANTLIQRITDGKSYTAGQFMLIPVQLLAIISWLSLQLSKQKKNDFKPRNDDLSFARVNTEPCVACCEILEKVRDAAIQNISGKNREAFLTEIGVSFHRFVAVIWKSSCDAHQVS